MSDKPLLSVIIAVYKAESTIERCLDSIFVQRDELVNPDEIEVVAVNDGSPDSSGEVMERYRATHPALKILTHSENQGVAETRNTGIESSIGEYFTFLDADDEYAPNAILTILDAINEHHPDLVHYCYSRFSPGGKFISQTHFKNPGLHTTTADDESNLCAVYHDTAFGLMSSGGVYRRALAPDLQYSHDFQLSEDRHFGWEFFRHCRNVVQIDKPLYIYYQYKNSVSRQLTEGSAEGLLDLDRIFWEEFKMHPMFPKAAKYGFRRLFPGVVGWHFDIVFRSSPERRNLVQTYFRSLASYLDSTAKREIGFGRRWLMLAVSWRSPLMIEIFRIWTYRIWIPLKSKLIDFVSRKRIV